MERLFKIKNFTLLECPQRHRYVITEVSNLIISVHVQQVYYIDAYVLES